MLHELCEMLGQYWPNVPHVLIEPAERHYPVEVSATLRAYQQEVAREVAPAEREPAPGAL